MTYKISDNGVVREMTDDEIANLEAIEVEAKAMRETAEAQAVAKQNALAKLAALGLDELELKALGLKNNL